jgi:hypothetical protein
VKQQSGTLFPLLLFLAVKWNREVGIMNLYAAGFLYGMLSGMSLPLCGDIGSILAGKVIEIIGARLPDVLWPEIKNLVKRVTYKQLE